MKKKILSLLLVLVLAFSSLLFVACGQRQVVTENPVVSEAHNEEPAPAEQAADAVTAAPATDGYIKFADGGAFDGTGFTGGDPVGQYNIKVSQYGNSVSLTGTLQGHYNSDDEYDLSNGQTAINYHHKVVLSLESEYRVGDDNAEIANVAFWTPILDDDSNPTSNYGFDDGDDDYADVDADYAAGKLTINTDKHSSLKIKVTFNDENETEKEYTIDLSQLRGAKGDNITTAERDVAQVFKAYDAEDEEYEATQTLDSATYEVSQYNKEFVISGTLPYYQQASTEFGAGYIVVLKLKSAERLAANAKSVYSVSGGDAKIYNNQDLNLLEELYAQAEEHTDVPYINDTFLIVWRMDKGNTAPLTLKVTWADYAVEQTYTINLASNVAYQPHNDGITEVTAPATADQMFHTLGAYVDGENVLGATKDHRYNPENYKYDTDNAGELALVAQPNYSLKQYDREVNLTGTAVHYSVFEGKAVGYGAQLTFAYVGNNDEFEIGEKFQVKEDGKVIYSWDAENEVAKSAYGSTYNLQGNDDSFEYFPVFSAKGESHTVEVTWFEGCTASYVITFNPTTLGQYGDWMTTFSVEDITSGNVSDYVEETSEYQAAVAADADFEYEITSANGDEALLQQHGKTITVNGAKLPYIDFTEIELEDGYYIALHLTPNDVKQRPVASQLIVKLDGKEVDVLVDCSILVKLSQANESHKVSVQWNSDVVAQEYTVNFVNNYFLTIEE